MSALNLSAGWLIILVALASARTFRLVVVDTITQPMRDVLEVYVFPKSKLAREGFACPWCIGAWFALGWALTAMAWGDTWPWQALAIMFSANYIAATLNALYDLAHEAAEDALNDE